MRILTLILALALDFVPGGDAYIKQLQQRDSILIADQIEYGFKLEGVKPGTGIALQDFSKLSNDTLVLVRNWQLDTLNFDKKTGVADIQGSIVLAPFEEGSYTLPPIAVRRNQAGIVDTLLFEPVQMEVKSMPVDTATFEIHDLKGQIKYPVTFKEVLPWILGGLLLAAIIALAIYLIKRHRDAKIAEEESKDPPYVVALRKLDKFRGDKYWAPDKQKIFYSGVTDALKEYIDHRFGVDAPEMTTAELFDALKADKDITPEMYANLKDLFERADFVKFAKYTAPDTDNAGVLPLAVGFVTSTYQSQLEEEQKTEDVL